MIAYRLNFLTTYCHRVVYAPWRNNYVGPSLYDLHIWTDDVMIGATAKVWTALGTKVSLMALKSLHNFKGKYIRLTIII